MFYVKCKSVYDFNIFIHKTKMYINSIIGIYNAHSFFLIFSCIFLYISFLAAIFKKNFYTLFFRVCPTQLENPYLQSCTIKYLVDYCLVYFNCSWYSFAAAVKHCKCYKASLVQRNNKIYQLETFLKTYFTSYILYIFKPT